MVWVEKQNSSSNLTFSLNTGSTCFLCINDVFQVKDDNEECRWVCNNSKVQQCDKFSLRNLCRFLRIHPSGTLKSMRASLLAKEDHSTLAPNIEEKLERSTDFSVTICKKCSVLAWSLSDLCAELELLQMKVDHYLDLFCKLLKNSEANKKLSNKVCFSNAGNSRGAEQMMHGELFKALRIEMKEKCNKRLRCAQPKVLITKEARINQKKRSANEDQPACLNAKDLCSNAVEVFSLKPVSILPSTSVQHLPLNTFDTAQDEDDQMISYKGQHKKYHLVPESQQPTCQVCKISFNSASEWLRHTGKCTGPVNTNTAVKINSSLVKENTTITTVKESKSYVCTLCSPNLLTLKSNKELKRHKIRNHVETFLSHYKVPTFSQTEFKEYCEYVFKVELLSCGTSRDADGNPCCSCRYCSKNFPGPCNLRHHLFSEHNKTIGKKLLELQKSTTILEIRELIFPSFSFSKNSYWKCVNCKAQFGRYSSYHKHKSTNQLCKSVRDKPKQKKKDMLPESREEKKKRNRKQSLPTNLSSLVQSSFQLQPNLPALGVSSNPIKNGRTSRPTKNSKAICNQCCPPRQFSRSWEFKRHKIRLHTETFFTSLKSRHHSMTDFKVFCDYVLRLEESTAQRTYTTKGRIISKCPHCLRTFSNETSMCYHLVSQHQDILSAKLVVVQQTKSLEEVKLGLYSVRERIRARCVLCKATFKNERCWYHHKKYVCNVAAGSIPVRTKSGQLKCDYCGQIFRHYSSVVRHVRIKHFFNCTELNPKNFSAETSVISSTLSEEESSNKESGTEIGKTNDHIRPSCETNNFHHGEGFLMDNENSNDDYNVIYDSDKIDIKEYFVAEDADNPFMILPHGDPLENL